MAFGGKEILLVDGYNVLRCGAYDDVAGVSPDFTDWTSDDYNNARLALLNDVALYVDNRTEAYVIFDAKNNPSGEFKAQKFGRVNVRFSDFGKSADETIEAICHSALARGLHVKVVTSDHVIRDIVDRKNVVCYGAVQFCAMLKNAGESVSNTTVQTITHANCGTCASSTLNTNCNMKNSRSSGAGSSSAKMSVYHSTDGDAPNGPEVYGHADSQASHTPIGVSHHTKIEDAIDADTLQKLEALLDAIQ